MRFRRALALALWLFAALPGGPATACRLALILGLDVSFSVDSEEYALQRLGLALALTDPQVMAAMIGPPGAQVELLVFEWSGRVQHNLVVDWTTIDSPETLHAIALTLSDLYRSSVRGLTSIGKAMLFAKARFQERPNCAAHTLDLSGDGRNNDGLKPGEVKRQLAASGIIVNGLVIGTDDDVTLTTGVDNIADLKAYYHRQVIVGAGAFVETALGFEDYAPAIKRKLLREVLPAMVQRGSPSRHQPI